MTNEQLAEIEQVVTDAPALDINTREGKLILAAFRFVHFARAIIDRDQFQFIREVVADSTIHHWVGPFHHDR